MHPLVSLAKTAVEKYIKTREIIEPQKKIPQKFLTKKSGVFVTIKKNNQLRGCIGTCLPCKKNIATEVISNAISAASKDYRFDQIKKEDLPLLSYTVCLLSKPVSVKEINQLNPKKFGIIVKSAPNQKTPSKTAVLLPNLKGIDTPQSQISIACQKGNIDPKQEDIVIYKFKTTEYGRK